MFTPIVAGAMVVLALAQQTDSTFPVPAGARLELDDLNGTVVVGTWGRAAMRVQADHSSRTRIEIETTGSVVSVRAEGRRGPAGVVDYRITVPASLGVDIHGTNADITIQDVEGEITAETVQGDLRVRGGGGRIVLHTVSGSVTSEGARGRLEAGSVSGDVRVADAAGAISTETVSGDILLDGISSSDVRAATVSGEIDYEGTVRDDGRYTFTAHSGDITLIIPEGTNAAVELATVSGDFEIDFPISMLATRGRGRRSFILGSGSAQLDLESFSGDVVIRRGATRPRE